MQTGDFKRWFKKELQTLARTDIEYYNFLGKQEADVIMSLYETRNDIRLYLDQQQVVETLDKEDFLEATKKFLKQGGHLEVIVDDTTLVPSDFPVPIVHTKSRWRNDGLGKNIHFIVAYGFSAFKVEGENKRFGEFGSDQSVSILAYILEWEKLKEGVPAPEEIARKTMAKP